MTALTSFIRFGLQMLLAGIFGSAIIFASAYLYLSPNLPPVDTLREVRFQTPLRVYTSEGDLLGEFGEKRRTPVSFEQIPTQFVQALLAAEDDRYYQHQGVDIKGLMRAASQLINSGQIQTGGSTITMQVARNFFLSQQRTFTRKFREILLALQIERELNKDEILELYVNKIFLGHRAYGIGAAAQVYYGTHIDQLNLAQLAMIAGLPKAPSAFNPITNPKRALVRRNWILDRMLHLGYIDSGSHQQAVNEPVSAKRHQTQLAANAPYVAEMVRQQLSDEFGDRIYTDGFHAYTTLQTQRQELANQAVVDGLMAYDKRHGYRGREGQLTDADKNWPKALKKHPSHAGLQAAAITNIEDNNATAILANGETITLPWQDGMKGMRRFITRDRITNPTKQASDLIQLGDIVRVRQDQNNIWQLTQLPQAQAALVALDPNNGAIRALVGGFDFYHSKYNRITQAQRQPGSNFKPFIYSAALESGFTAASIINDAPIVIDDMESTWRPVNSGDTFEGPTRLRKALYRSRNLVSIRLLRRLGIKPAIDYATRFGFTKEQLPHSLSLALGTLSATPLQIATGYASFANGGYKISPYFIDRVTDLNEQTVFEHLPLTVCHECPDPTDQVSGLISTEGEKIPALDDLESLSNELASDDHNLAAIPTNQAPRIMDKGANYIINSIMRDVIQRGTGYKAKKLGRNDIGGKTGTTNGPTDAWFSGYNKSLVATAWVGFDKNEELGRREYGGTAALPIWMDFMAGALQDTPDQIQSQPNGVITARIDSDTGLRTSPDDPDGIIEYFRTDNLPAQQGSAGADGLASESEIPEDLF